MENTITNTGTIETFYVGADVTENSESLELKLSSPSDFEDTLALLKQIDPTTTLSCSLGFFVAVCKTGMDMTGEYFTLIEYLLRNQSIPKDKLRELVGDEAMEVVLQQVYRELLQELMSNVADNPATSHSEVTQ